jgi:hypothetical protein
MRFRLRPKFPQKNTKVTKLAKTSIMVYIYIMTIKKQFRCKTTQIRIDIPEDAINMTKKVEYLTRLDGRSMAIYISLKIASRVLDEMPDEQMPTFLKELML